MRTVTVMLCLAATAAMAGLLQAIPLPPPTVVPHRPTIAPPPAAAGPAQPWLALERLSPGERANALVHIEPGRPGIDDAVRRIEQLWNSGNCDEALAQFRSLGGSCDLSCAFVGINWRTPIPTTQTDNWDPNVRIGNRDSAYCTAFDRNAVNGNLLVSLLRHAGATTFIDTYLSTDGGATWPETFEGSWTTAPGDLEGTCTGPHFYVAYPYVNTGVNQVACIRFDATNGQYVQFPSGAWSDTVFQPAPDTVTEIAMCSAEEMWPGQRAYAFGRTTGDSLLYAWADSAGEPWHRYPTNIGACSGGRIDCAVNTGYPSGGRWIWASFMFYSSVDTLKPALAWMVDSTATWSFVSFNAPTPYSLNTSIAAWKDSVLMAYTYRHKDTFYTRGVFSNDGGGSWFDTYVPDTLAKRELPDVTGAHGEGFAVVQREYSSDRAIMYTHSGYDVSSWSTQDTVSDHVPDWIERPRIQWIAPETYGVVYLTWDESVYNSVWFSRNSWTGVADRHSAGPTLFGLRAIPMGGGVRLAFDNPAAGRVSLRVFDAAGRLAHSEDRVLNAGHNVLGLAGPTAGIYFAQLEALGKTATAKFFIAK